MALDSTNKVAVHQSIDRHQPPSPLYRHQLLTTFLCFHSRSGSNLVTRSQAGKTRRYPYWLWQSASYFPLSNRYISLGLNPDDCRPSKDTATSPLPQRYLLPLILNLSLQSNSNPSSMSRKPRVN
ncbi:hypothetical protein MJO28_017728 [Puccinia striiformis f. sp. tritici]|nr:hypothetical protein MJO28_017728 [Puccinia striiformis f. sp. tritici]KAI7939633.1 hypothetical protein MJO29_014369 [Puccinia striiformis f. sp. tritici]